MKYECFENDCYNLYTINTPKFKNCHIEVVFRNKCTKENITYLALLFDVLMENSLEFPSKKLLARRKQDLYNVNIFSVNSRVGNTLITNVVADFLDPKYMEKDSLEDIIKLLFSLIFKPNVNADEFDLNTFERVKKRLASEIDALKENPKQQSILSALKALDEENPRSFNSCGDREILESITPKKLYKFYEKVLNDSLVDIYIVGNLDMNEVNKICKKYSEFKSIKTEKLELYLDEIKVRKCMNVSETNTLSQTNFVQVYGLKDLDDWETRYVVPIFNMLWGSGSLDSKLYKTVRGENSLCYNIGTYYQNYDKIITLQTAVDKENVNLTIKLIKKCLTDMIKGNITEEELSNVKMILTNSLNLIYDSPNRLTDNYLFSNIAGLPEIEKRIEEFQKVSIDDLVKVAKKLNLLINYRIGD